MPTYKRGDQVVHTIAGSAHDRALAADNSWRQGDTPAPAPATPDPAPAPADTTEQPARPTARRSARSEQKDEAN
jgi:hypothetical protein